MHGENPEITTMQDEGFYGEEEDKEVWADENLDEEIKAFIAVYENGKEFQLDIVSHLEYFYNTLDCNFSTKNPFEQPSAFRALQYKEPI